MFVEIENPMSPIVTDYFIKTSRKKGFSVLHAFEVLKNSCHYGNIRTVLKIIDNLPSEEQINFKDAVIAMVDGRENSQSNFEILHKLAINGGYVDEFDVANKKDKIYSKNGLKIFRAQKLNDVLGNIASDYNMLICDFDDDFKVKIWCCLPCVCDFRRCDKVDLRKEDLENVKLLKFAKGARVNLSEAKNLPKLLDVSNLNEIHLAGCDLGPVEKIKFKLNAKVDFDEAYNFPEDIDFYDCKYVYLRGCNLENVKALKFGNGSIVFMDDAINLPKYVNVAKCEKIKLLGVDFSNVEKIIFRDKEQILASGFDRDSFNGKIICLNDNINNKGFVR